MMKKFLLLAIMVATPFSLTVLAQSGAGAPGGSASAPLKASIAKDLTIQLPAGALAADAYTADISHLSFSDENDARKFLDMNSCNVLSYSLNWSERTVTIHLAKYDGFTDSFSVQDWNTWLAQRSELIRANYTSVYGSTH